MKLFAKVESVFEISNRGTVIVPVWLSDWKVRNGDPIQLRAPGGQVRDTHISGVEFLHESLGKGCRLAFILPRDVRRQDIAEGSEIWVTGTQEKAEAE